MVTTYQKPSLFSEHSFGSDTEWAKFFGNPAKNHKNLKVFASNKENPNIVGFTLFLKPFFEYLIARIT